MSDQPETRVKQAGGMWFAQVAVPGPMPTLDQWPLNSKEPYFVCDQWQCIPRGSFVLAAPTATNLQELNHSTEHAALRAVSVYLAREESRKEWPAIVRELLK